jgi:hypothetical protein
MGIIHPSESCGRRVIVTDVEREGDVATRASLRLKGIVCLKSGAEPITQDEKPYRCWE